MVDDSKQNRRDMPALLPGTLDMLVLKTLTQGAMHGYAIAASIELASGDKLRVEEGALYPALHRLEARGWLKSEWGFSERRRKAKYYRLTPSGEQQLASEAARWSDRVAAIQKIMQPPTN